MAWKISWQKTRPIGESLESLFLITVITVLSPYTTLHFIGTNKIIIQNCLWTINNDINTNPPVKHVRRRFFKPVSNELQPYIKTKARLNPVAIPIVDTGVN